MNSEEDEFNRIEREASLRKAAVKSAVGKGIAEQPTTEESSAIQPAPVQEPVAWIYSQGAAKVVSMNYVPGVRATPLYTTPPAQEFVCSTGLCHYKAKSDERMMEPWKPSDTAHRPGGLPQDFIKHEVENEGDWSEWVNPNSEQYFMKCCDCGLVHEMQFKVAKYSEGDECEFVADADLQSVFRARRAAQPAAPVQEPVAQDVQEKCRIETVPAKGGLLPTPPAAQRQWVGLTDEDFENAFQETYIMGDSDLKDFAQVIEAKLKEKNT